MGTQMTWESLALGAMVVINLWITNLLWQEARRGPKRKFLKRLRYGKPIAPKHKPPRKPEGEGGLASLVTETDRLFFADFAKFAELLNQRLAEDQGARWRVQEIPDPELRLLGPGDMPSYGHRYDIFYNQTKVGNLEMSGHRAYGKKAWEVSAAIELNYARVLPFQKIADFIYWIAELTTARGEERRAVTLALHAAMLDQLWEIKYDRNIDDRAMGGHLRVQFSGTADTETLAKVRQISL